LPEGACRERGQPESDGSGREADNETARAAATCERIGGDSAQRGRESGKQHPERVPLHAPSVLLLGERLLALALVLAVALLLLLGGELLVV
jgi:hypothetical protein